MGFLPAGVCVIALLSLFLLGRSQMQLKDNIDDIYRVAGAQRVRLGFLGLLTAPPLISFSVGVIVFLQVPDQLLNRASHAALALGVWMVLALAFLVMILITRLGLRPSLPTLAAALLAVPLAAYLTPIERFNEVFQASFQWFPLVTGLILIVACYLLILAARQSLYRRS